MANKKKRRRRRKRRGYINGSAYNTHPKDFYLEEEMSGPGKKVVRHDIDALTSSSSSFIFFFGGGRFLLSNL
jgi:hypothetical protein